MDEALLNRLGEIGIDVYLPRTPRTPLAGAATDAPASHTVSTAAQGVVVLVAQVTGTRVAALVGAIERALVLARVACRRVDAVDEAAFADARALVAFGDAHARAAGRVLSAQRQQEIAWVVTGEPAALAGDARAKRALWSELKRILRPRA